MLSVAFEKKWINNTNKKDYYIWTHVSCLLSCIYVSIIVLLMVLQSSTSSTIKVIKSLSTSIQKYNHASSLLSLDVQSLCVCRSSYEERIMLKLFYNKCCGTSCHFQSVSYSILKVTKNNTEEYTTTKRKE